MFGGDIVGCARLQQEREDEFGAVVVRHRPCESCRVCAIGRGEMKVDGVGSGLCYDGQLQGAADRIGECLPRLSRRFGPSARLRGPEARLSRRLAAGVVR